MERQEKDALQHGALDAEMQLTPIPELASAAPWP